jgi:hypothetical protein
MSLRAVMSFDCGDGTKKVNILRGENEMFLNFTVGFLCVKDCL